MGGALVGASARDTWQPGGCSVGRVLGSNVLASDHPRGVAIVVAGARWKTDALEAGGSREIKGEEITVGDRVEAL